MTSQQLDRAAGALVGLAVGDALGAPYEFGSGIPDPKMTGRGRFGWAPGEWTDDTQEMSDPDDTFASSSPSNDTRRVTMGTRSIRGRSLGEQSEHGPDSDREFLEGLERRLHEMDDHLHALRRELQLRLYVQELAQDDDLRAKVADLDRRLKAGLPTDLIDGREAFERHRQKHLSA